MTFISIVYALFLSSLLAIYWTANKQRSRLLLLSLASLIFYASLQVQYIPLLLIGIWINYRLGLAIAQNTPTPIHIGPVKISTEQEYFAQTHWNRRRSLLLAIGILFNVFLLLSFKYIPFLLTIVRDLFGIQQAGEVATWVDSNIAAPLGLSFFSFECIAYLVDVYRGAPASQKLLQFTTYKLFFPKLISGPITRYHQFSKQLKTLIFPQAHQWVEGLWWIACGAVKKGLIADRLGIYVDLSFQNLQRAGSEDLWLATIAYGLQLYLDFSGYVDIARGSAMLLGFNLPPNFNFPYLSTSIADFWRRWHMSLGDWLRNYLYFPLGGSRVSLARTCVNLAIVMLVAGIWHGAAWGFIVWGGLHGAALVVHRLSESLSKQVGALAKWWKTIPGIVVAWFSTQLMVFFSWIFFRLPQLKDSGWAISHLWGHAPDVQFSEKVYLETLGIDRLELALVLGSLWLLMFLSYFIERGLRLQINWPLKMALVPVCLYVVWLFAPEGSLPYIYFDF
ncbi:MBOAT family O-acyltransferase [Oxynema aestuarii]|uniref:MBOAT family protein n=1 Tax=Oxynema aestuarii AP17 TaxID=2064643 RepID=A0A6H1U407_9CYAN|nr:MBOAT family protein [Oxynema aestuarii]QIZ73166.1 MBOAT family protein [Oxynema aestuarii AP17]